MALAEGKREDGRILVVVVTPNATQLRGVCKAFVGRIQCGMCDKPLQQVGSSGGGQSTADSAIPFLR